MSTCVSICGQCNKEYTIPLHMKGKRKYCSLKCAYASPTRTTTILTPELIKYLKDNYTSDRLTMISKALKMSRTTICRLARKLGLNKQFGRGRICSIEHRKNMSITRKGRPSQTKGQPRWNNKPHPRGMLGKHHTLSVKQYISSRLTGRIVKQETINKTLDTKMKRYGRLGPINSINQYSRTTKGWRDYNGGKHYYLRSKWEMNYCRYLDWMVANNKIKEWLYEEDIFWFDRIKRGIRSYTPDFKITNNDGSIEYHEVKGWMDNKSKTKLKRMKIYHPTIKLIIIDEKAYKELKKDGAIYNFEE